jgi:hypothetical protein
MLVTAFEMCAWSEAMPAHGLMIAQAGLNVLRDPAAAARDLLGLDGAAVRESGDDAAGGLPARRRRRA